MATWERKPFPSFFHRLPPPPASSWSSLVTILGSLGIQQNLALTGSRPFSLNEAHLEKDDNCSACMLRPDLCQVGRDFKTERSDGGSGQQGRQWAARGAACLRPVLTVWNCGLVRPVSFPEAGNLDPYITATFLFNLTSSDLVLSHRRYRPPGASLQPARLSFQRRGVC